MMRLRCRRSERSDVSWETRVETRRASERRRPYACKHLRVQHRGEAVVVEHQRRERVQLAQHRGRDLVFRNESTTGGGDGDRGNTKWHGALTRFRSQRRRYLACQVRVRKVHRHDASRAFVTAHAKRRIVHRRRSHRGGGGRRRRHGDARRIRARRVVRRLRRFLRANDGVEGASAGLAAPTRTHP